MNESKQLCVEVREVKRKTAHCLIAVLEKKGRSVGRVGAVAVEGNGGYMTMYKLHT